MSSASTFSSILRTMIMMVLLLAIPVIAICRPSAPQSFMRMLGDRFPMLALSGAESPPPAESATLFEPLATEVLAVPQDFPSIEHQRLVSRDSGAGTQERSAVTPAGYDAPINAGSAAESPAGSHGGASSRSATTTLADPFMSASVVGKRELTATDPGTPSGEPTDLRTLGTHDVVPSPASDETTAAIGGRGDQFSQYQKRLRELGATYFLLESWGTSQQLYRFYCKMAVGGNPNCTRPFEATNADPLTAMSLVLKQVEQWQSEQRPL